MTFTYSHRLDKVLSYQLDLLSVLYSVKPHIELALGVESQQWELHRLRLNH